MAGIMCPRCKGAIPNPKEPGAFPGALSRADNETEICSLCGTDEAFEGLTQGDCSPVSAWPITRKFFTDADWEVQRDLFNQLQK